MKILRIRFGNLNSLRGEWDIDLSNSKYTASGIFAITGPTGAGKTTIFDAVCLALYGQTPRLGSVTSGSNEIMSRGKNSCYAHVTFSTQKGRTFTCKWEQQRKGKDKFQTPKHIIEDSDNNIPLTDKTTDTIKEVERLTGMDFKRFTRAMMLEQGKFDSFLTATKNERAELLELITGTEIYSDISREVYEREKYENGLLRDKTIELGAIKSSGAGMTRDEVLAELERRKTALSQQEAAFKSAREARDWLREIRTIERDLTGNNEDIAAQSKRMDNFEAQRAILDRAERAADIEAEYTQLAASRTAKLKCADEIMRLQEAIRQREAILAGIAELLPKLEAKLAEIRHGITDSPDAVVLRVKTAVEDYLQALKERKDSVRKSQEAEASVQALRRNLAVITSEAEKAQAKMNEASLSYNQAFSEFMALRARTTAAVLDEERPKLKPGSPCPLCGSTEHPACAGEHTAGENSGALFSAMDRFTEKLDSLKNALEVAQKKHSELSDKRTKCSAELSAAMDKVLMFKEETAAKTERLSACHSAVSEAIRPIGLSGINGTEAVISKTNEWAATVMKIEDRIQSSQTDKGKLEASLATDSQNLERKKNELTDEEAELSEREASFSARLAEKGFSGEQDFASSRLHIKEIPTLRNIRQEIDERMNALKALNENLNRKYSEKKAMNLTTQSIAEAEAEFSRREAEVIAAKGTLASLAQKLGDIEAQEHRTEELERALEAQKLIAGRWAELSDMIGSSKGDKYRVFAQQVTLELVVNNANKYLNSMNGRYSLMLRPESDDLLLSVIDKEQAGEIRPTDNLSGGERFIVSLALALGLSQISGSKARVDSLFLDEGFGSLDEDSLNTALEALDEIHREGRMIGIISHVAALKERISAQIRVIPQREGVSVLEGPGCSKL